jgi:hypothetical protein
MALSRSGTEAAIVFGGVHAAAVRRSGAQIPLPPVTVASAPPRAPARTPTRKSGPEAALLAAVTLVLLAFFLGLYPLRGYRFPVGSDSPVYLWWARLSEGQGLPAVGTRSGLPALALMLAGTMRVPITQVLAGLGAALGTAVGLASAALVRVGLRSSGPARPTTAAFVLAGILSGTFAVHLAEGYFANLAFVVVFLAALVTLAGGTRAGVVGAACFLGAGAILHPLFFGAGAIILALTAAPSLLRRPSGTRLRDTEGARIGAALGGGAVIGAVGLGAVAAAGGAYRADTSKDAFARRMGLDAVLRADYLDRFLRHVARYWLPVSVPLGVLGALFSGGFLGRVMRAWGIVLVAGVLGALATGLAPADRFITFGYVLPIGSALGIVWLVPRLARRSRILAGVVAVAVVGVLVGGVTVTWLRERPFMSPDEVRAVTRADRYIEATPPGTPLVFLVDNRRPTISFLTTRAANIIRAAVPPERIRDVYLYVGSPRHYLAGEPTLIGPGAAVHDLFSRQYLRELKAAGGRPLAFVLRPFNPHGFTHAQASQSGVKVAPGVVVLGTPPPAAGPPVDPIASASPWRIVAVGVGLLLLLSVIGLGWALGASRGVVNGFAVAPAAGVAVLVLAGVALDRLGRSIGGGTALAVASAVAVCGYATAYLGWRRRRTAQRGDVLQRPAAHGSPDKIDQ